MAKELTQNEITEKHEYAGITVTIGTAVTTGTRDGVATQ